MEDFEKKYYEIERLEKAKKALDNLMTDRGFDIKGVHVMLTVRDIQVIFFLQYRPALRFIRRYFTPMGGVVKAGKRLLIHPWAVKRFLNMVGRCPECGRHWDDKLAKAEIEGKLGESTTPFMSTGGLQGGLKIREDLRALGADDITLEDIKPRPSIFGEHGTDRYYPEESPAPDLEEQYFSKLPEQGVIEPEEEEKPRKKPPVRSVVNKLPRRHN